MFLLHVDIQISSGEKSFSRASVGLGEQNFEEIDIVEAAGNNEYYNYYGYYDEDRLFVEAILNGKPVPCGAEDALKTMYLLDMMKENEMSAQ